MNRTMNTPALDQRADRAFRPRSRRRSRLALAVALGALAVAGNVVVYSSLDDRTPVLQVVRDVPAGTAIAADDLRVVEASLDPSVRAVPAGDLPLVAGAYAKVRLVAGSLVVREALQSEPLMGDGMAVVAVEMPEAAVPLGLQERARVRLVVPPQEQGGPTIEVDGRVVGLPASASTVSGAVSLSVEVPEASATRVAAGTDVRVVLLHPAGEPGEAMS